MCWVQFNTKLEYVWVLNLRIKHDFWDDFLLALQTK